MWERDIIIEGKEVGKGSEIDNAYGVSLDIRFGEW